MAASEAPAVGIRMTSLTELTGMVDDASPTEKKALPVDTEEAAGNTIAVDGYRLEGSIWDSTLLIGASVAGMDSRPAAGTFSVLLVLINVAIQTGLGFIVVTSFCDPQYGDSAVVSLRQWRRNIAHDVKYLDTVSKNSLAARVCKGEAGLGFGNSQASTYVNVKSYLENDKGVTLCILALAVWIMSIVNDISHTFSLLRATYELWRQGHEETVLVLDDVGEVSITGVSSMRFLGVSLVMLSRLMVAGGLLYAGSLWLAYTVSLQDLMLNAVALEFVLNVDELIFISLAPLSLKYLVENAKMLPKQAPPAWKGLELSTAINFVVVAGALGVFIQSVLLPQVDTLWRVVDAICGGEHGFVYSVDGAGLPVWAKTHRANPVLCRGPDTSRCSSLGSDCCAPVSKDEAATCRDGYVPLRVSGKCTGVSKGNVTGTFNEGRYTCCQQYVSQRPSRGWTPASKSELANMTFPQKVIDKVLGTTPADEELCLAKHCGYTVTNGVYKFGKHPCCQVLHLKSKMVSYAPGSVYEAANELPDDSLYLVYDSKCGNLLQMAAWYGHYKDMNAFADAASVDVCQGGCPDPFKPFCRNGTCVRPDCTIDAMKYCSQPSVAGIRARQYCAQACGCGDPMNPTLMTTTGCNHCKKSPRYIAASKVAPCTDQPANSSLPKQYAAALLQYANEAGGSEIAPEVIKMSVKIGEKGCGAISEASWGMNYCNLDESSLLPVKPMSFLCPVTCKCQRGAANCPLSCPCASPTNNGTGCAKLTEVVSFTELPEGPARRRGSGYGG